MTMTEKVCNELCESLAGFSIDSIDTSRRSFTLICNGLPQYNGYVDDDIRNWSIKIISGNRYEIYKNNKFVARVTNGIPATVEIIMKVCSENIESKELKEINFELCKYLTPEMIDMGIRITNKSVIKSIGAFELTADNGTQFRIEARHDSADVLLKHRLNNQCAWSDPIIFALEDPTVDKEIQDTIISTVIHQYHAGKE